MDEFDKLQQKLQDDADAEHQDTVLRYQRDMNEQALHSATDLGPDQAFGVENTLGTAQAFSSYASEAGEAKADLHFLPQSPVGPTATLPNAAPPVSNVVPFPNRHTTY